MSATAIGFLSIGALFVLLAVRVPIGIALASISLAGIWGLRGFGPAGSALGTLPYDFAASWMLSAVPMFLLMGAIAVHCGMTASIYDAARMWLARLPGGLAIATNIACAGFAAISGSSVATTAAMGKLAIPEMLRLGYDKSLATSVVAAAGTLGALIPPSIAFVIYGWYAEVPVGPLLIAGIVPGLLTAFVYSLLVYGRVKLRPELAPVGDLNASSAERWRATKQVWPLPVLMLAIIGGLFSGIVTPTEAAAAGAGLTTLIALVRRELSMSVMRRALVDAAETTAGLFLIIIGAAFFTRFLALAGVPAYLGEVLKAAAVSPELVIVAMTVIFLILGMFLEPIGIMLLTLPILIPVCRALGMDLIWVGVLVVKYIEIGLLTPPVGLHAFVVKSIVGDQVPLTTIFRGLAWFLAAEVVIMALLIAFPKISTWLPSLLG